MIVNSPDNALCDDTTPSVVAASAPTDSPAAPGLLGGVGLVVLYLPLQIGAAVVAYFVVGVAVLLAGGTMAHDRNAIGVAATALSLPFVAAVVAVLASRDWRPLWRRADLVGFGLVAPRQRWLAFLYAVALGEFLVGGGGALTGFLAGHHPLTQSIATSADSAPIALRVVLAMVVCTATPFTEELLFRGVLLSTLARRMPLWIAIVTSAVLFGLAHLPSFGFVWYAIPALVLLGVVSAWLRVRTGSLYPSIVLHATNNLIAVIPWFVATHHP